jgi:hypothetical protein
VGKDNFQLGEIDGDIVEVDGVAVFIAGSGKNGGSGMEHDGCSVGLGGAVDDFEFFHAVQIIVGEKQLVWRVNLDHAQA